MQTKFNLIDSLDLTQIKWKLTQSFEDGGRKFSEKECELAEIDYKRFLKLELKYSKKNLTPTDMVDHMWHMHILDTIQYRNMCNEIFGYFLDHVPSYDEKHEEDAFTETVNLYHSEFKEGPLTPHNAAFSSDGTRKAA